MIQRPGRWLVGVLSVFGTGLFLCVLGPGAYADQLEMQNGDRYFGKVLSLSSDTVVVESEMLGELRLPRGKVALIALGTNSLAGSAKSRMPDKKASRSSPAAPANANADLSQALKQLPASSNAVQQVRDQFLADADPKAREKFDELLGGLMTGKLSLSDIRSQAQTAADQIHRAKHDLGDDAGFALDGYLAILDRFLAETASSATGATNSPSNGR
ncbi:MAG: hypothetical protein C5B50_25945 [Verrucomicrobia bacterium]|nr:MAG: hypothetical protein C5B50_25945 [Verrucomicrobiota bacterium]